MKHEINSENVLGEHTKLIASAIGKVNKCLFISTNITPENIQSYFEVQHNENIIYQGTDVNLAIQKYNEL